MHSRIEYVFIASSSHKKPMIVLKYLVNGKVFNSENTVIVTDKASGRLAVFAKRYNISCYPTDSVAEQEAQIIKHQPEYLISCGWHSKIPNDIIRLPKKASLNCHGSLLPDYKGASVFKHYWSNWEREVGASIHLMTDKIDSGNIISSLSAIINHPTTPQHILIKTSQLTGPALVDAINKIEKGETGQKQVGGRYFYKLSAMSHIKYWLYNGLATFFRFKKTITPHRIINSHDIEYPAS